MNTYDVKVYRYDPSIDAMPRYEVYQLATDTKMKVLDACAAIASDYRTDLAFRASCLMGRCGSCAVLLNGKHVLACQAVLEPGLSVIEPLPGYPVMKDLITDRTPYEETLKSVRAYLEDSGFDRPKLFSYGKDLYSLSLCTECLLCQAACPARQEIPAEFSGPAVMCQIARYAVDPRDQADRARTALLTGIHSCTSCMTCSEVCPKRIDVFGQSIRPFRQQANRSLLPGPQVQRGIVDTFKQTGLALPKTQPLLTDEIDLPEAGGGTGVFLGCMFNAKHKRWGLAVIDALQRADRRVVLPKQQVCCGAPLLWTGNRDEAISATRRNVEAFNASGASEVVTACAGCGLAWKKEYRALYEECGIVPNFRVMDLTEALVEFGAGLAVPPLAGRRIGYFEACHQRSQHPSSDYRQVLDSWASKSGGSVLDVKFPVCCGGMAASSDPRLAARLASKVIDSALRAGLDTIVTTCPFCVENLDRASRRSRSNISVIHISDLHNQ